jgi:hypothetical protein
MKMKLIVGILQNSFLKAQTLSTDCGEKNETIYKNCRQIKYDQLPDGIIELIKRNKCDVNNESNYNYGYSFELNNDNQKEYLFCCMESPHGPCAANLYSRINNTWEIILTTAGYESDCDKVLIILKSQHDGFYDLCINNKLFKFSEGRYVETSSTKLIGRFNIEKDLYLAQFDSKTDTDDLHSVAGVKTILSDPRFSKVKYHAVAGAYGIQEGLYVPPNEVFEIAFGTHWSDAHSNFEQALGEVTKLVTSNLKDGGDIWIAEAGQSDFSASLIKNIKNNFPSIKTKLRIHIVQHSNWNENNTATDNLSYVKENADYIKIPDGNVVGNGSPGFYTEEKINWRNYITDSGLINVWEKAFEIANKYNGQDGRHTNPAIASGGMDFSDVSETCWIFGFNHLKNAVQFFEEFSL